MYDFCYNIEYLPYFIILAQLENPLLDIVSFSLISRVTNFMHPMAPTNLHYVVFLLVSNGESASSD